MRILPGRTVVWVFAQLTSVVLLLESLLFLLLVGRNVFRFANSLGDAGTPAYYLLLFILLQIVATVFCVTGFFRIRKRLAITNARVGEPLFERGGKRRLTAKEIAIRVALLTGFQVCAFGIAPFLYIAAAVNDDVASASWLQAVPIVVAAGFYLAFRIYPRGR